MRYRIFYKIFTIFYCSWGWTSGRRVGIPDCSPRLHYCMVENGYRAVICKNGPVSVPNMFNNSLWTVVPKGSSFCGQFGHRIVELDQSVRSEIQSLRLKCDGVVTFVCPAKDICYWRVSIVHVMSMAQLLNVSLVYHGNQFIGEIGKLTCTIDWARNDTWIRKTWLRTRERTIGSSLIGIQGDDGARSQKYTVVFDSLKREDANEYQCRAIGLAFGALPIQVSAVVVIDPRTRDIRSIHGITSTPLFPILESSTTGSTKNRTWTLTETTNSIMTAPSFSNLLIINSVQTLALQRTQTSATYSLYENSSTLSSRLLSSLQPKSYTLHSQPKTSKSRLLSTPLFRILESSMTGSTKNGTWTLTETANSIMTAPLFSNLPITSSIHALALQRTQTSAVYSLHENSSTLDGSLLSSPQPESYTWHSKPKTSKSQMGPTKDIPKASKSHHVPKRVRPICPVASAGMRHFSSLFLWHVFVSGSLVLCCIECL